MSEHAERALAEAFALGALDPPEKKLFEAHLVGCSICREAVRRAGVAVQAIALTAPAEKPPKGSGDRLMALYRQERPTWSPPPSRGSGSGPLLAVIFALAALGGSGWGFFEHERAVKAEKALAECHKDKVVLEAPDAQTLSMKAVGDFKGTAVAIYSPSKGVAILGKGLPEPPAGKCYKLWSVAGGDVKPMGAFQPGIFLDRSPGGVETKFAISEESDPNVEKATKVVLLPG